MIPSFSFHDHGIYFLKKYSNILENVEMLFFEFVGEVHVFLAGKKVVDYCAGERKRQTNYYPDQFPSRVLVSFNNIEQSPDEQNQPKNCENKFE